MKSRISWMFFAYICMLLYTIFVCYNFYNLNYRFENILQHPVQVLQEARELYTRLYEMRNIMPGLMSSPEFTYREMVEILNNQEEMQDDSFEIIKERYLGDKSILDRLEREIVEVRRARRDAVRLTLDNNDYNKAINMYNDIVAPEVNKARRTIEEIISTADERLKEKSKQTRRDSIFNMLLTFLMGIFATGVFIFANRRQQESIRQIKDRDRLFNQLSQNVDEIFIIAKNATNFQYITANSNRLIGIDSDAIRDDPKILYDFFPPDDAKWLKEILSKKDIYRQSGDKDLEHVIIKDNGSCVYRITIHPISQNNISSSIVTIQDKTKDFQHQQALSDALANAHAASSAKSNFLSHMSHEIRTPMNAIIGMTTIALSKITSRERVEDCLGKIAESSRHLLGLINDILDMSKIEHGKLSISHEPMNLPASIRNINDLVRPQAQARKLNFEILSESVEYENLIGDALRLNQILLNILSNSLKFTPAGGTISLKIRQLTKHGNMVRLAFIISDTGIGMSQEFLDRLYSPFEQASATTAAKYGGTGLGMSITLNLTNLMGGTIDVDSKVGEGSTFTVELPFEINENADPKLETLPHLKILVVDDDHGTCEHATLLLKKMGMNVTWCTSGREAVKLVQEAQAAAAPFDVCLVDWKMPEMDGAETSRKIRDVVGDDLLIIIISAYDWSPIEEHARKSGVNDFIAKPFFASTLHDVLISTIQRYGVVEAISETDDQKYDFSGKRILLVEDNEFNREIAREFLEMVNAEVEDAKNGQEAVEKFLASAAGYYDLILMDVQMPVMDGYDATKTIRASEHPDANAIHILALTANAFSEDVAHAIASGMNGHIAKPIDMLELYKLVNVHLPKI